MPGKYVKTKYRGVFLRSGIAYIRYAVPGKKRGSVVWESTGQRNVQLAAERLIPHTICNLISAVVRLVLNIALEVCL